MKPPLRTYSTNTLFVSLLVLAFAIYLPGLSGGFLFDDIPNLEPLGSFGGISGIESVFSYLQSGVAGPTGRPISLLSFLINDNGWPSEALGFKYTNILIHLLVGTLVFWAGYRLLIQIGRSSSDAALIALVAAAIWLLHPFFVSTTLYVVQRMSQLAALFALAAIIGYLHGRGMVKERRSAGLAWITLSLGLGTALATLSKENGALVPTLILMIEWSLARHWITQGPPLWWRIFFLMLPTLAVLGYLTMRLMGSGTLPNRTFDLNERLLTQPRILWEYLYQLFIPRIQTRGLFQDGYHFSTNLFTPWTTLPATLGIAALIVVAWALRTRLPLAALAIAFFLAGHLIESTTIGLELYFEHRSYLPAVFLFLPVAAALVDLRGHLRPALWIVMLITPIVTLSVLTHQRASLWGDTPRLLSVWANASPDSPRAQNSIAQNLYDQGNVAAALSHLREASERLPDSALLSIRLLIHQVDAGVATGQHFERAGAMATSQSFDAQTMAALDLLVTVVNQNLPNPVLAEATHSLLDAFLENPEYGRSRFILRHLPYLKMRLDLAEGDIKPALVNADIAMRRYNDTDTALAIVAYIANAGFEREALELFPKAQFIFANQSDSTLKRTRAAYEREFAHLETGLRDAAANSRTPTLLHQPSNPVGKRGYQLPPTSGR